MKNLSALLVSRFNWVFATLLHWLWNVDSLLQSWVDRQFNSWSKRVEVLRRRNKQFHYALLVCTSCGFYRLPEKKAKQLQGDNTQHYWKPLWLNGSISPIKSSFSARWCTRFVSKILFSVPESEEMTCRTIISLEWRSHSSDKHEFCWSLRNHFVQNLEIQRR